MVVAKILKYEPICNAFCGAITSASPISVLMPLVDGKPQFAKGALVAYIESPTRLFKGRTVSGQIKTISEVALSENAEFKASDIGKTIDEVEDIPDWRFT